MDDADRHLDQNRAGPPVARWKRWCLCADPWPLLLIALILSLYSCWVYRCPTTAMLGLASYHVFCAGAVPFALLAGGRSAQLLLRWECEARLQAPNVFRSRAWFWPWLILLATETCFAVESRLPMRAAFWLSRPALDRVAD